MPELLPPPTAGSCDSAGAASGLDWWWGLGLGCIYPLTVYELFPYQQPGWGPRVGRGAPPTACQEQLQTYRVPAPCATYQDLASGVALAQVLHRIDASWFSQSWLGCIRDNTGNDPRVKVSNLTKVLQSMLEYCQDVLGQPVPERHVPEVAVAAEQAATPELDKLLRLVLGCAVACERKQEHIQQIMTLEESVQHVVMAAIQELMTRDSLDTMSPEMYGTFDSQSRRYYFLSEEPDEPDVPCRRCRDLEQQVAALAEAARGRHETEVGGAARNLLLLQARVEQLQEENYRLESGREELRGHCEGLQRELGALRQRSQELGDLAKEAQALRDEMDMLRDSSERAGRLEGLLGSYRRRLEALGELRRQVRRLEEQDAAHARRAAALEDELRRAAPARAELDTCRRQVQELQGRQAQAALEAEKWQFECGSLREKLEALLKDKERLVEERDALREANEELRCAQVQQSCLSQADAVLDSATSPADNLAAEILPAELRETLVRLQQENRGLCAQEAALQGQLAELQAQLDDSRRVRSRLDTQHRLSQQEVLELRGQLEELQQSLQEQGSRAEDAISSVLKEKLEEHLEKLNEAHAELQKKREHLEGLEPRADSAAAQRIDELQQILRQKDEDMRAMEERYRRYVDKANSVIRRLDPAPGATGSLLGVQALRNQLQEKEAKLQYLEMDLAKTLSQREQEERLIITAWYNMGLAQQHCTSWDHSSPPGAPQSFLSQQRQAATARRGPPRLPRGPLH